MNRSLTSLRLASLPIAALAALGLALATGAAAAAQTAAGAPAAAQRSMTVSAAATSLTLFIIPLDHPEQPVDKASLECDPPGGTHPNPLAACDALKAVGGDFFRLPDSSGTFCPTSVDRVMAVADGTWEGGPVTYQETFFNRCAAEVGTDDVFKF